MSRYKVLWHPQDPAVFAVATPELFEIRRVIEDAEEVLYAHSSGDVPSRLSWSNLPSTHLLAVARQDGKSVRLINLADQDAPFQAHHVYKASRAITALQWSPFEPSKLAIGTQAGGKTQSRSLLVLDMASDQTILLDRKRMEHSTSRYNSSKSSRQELSAHEGINAVSWFPDRPLLAAALGGKKLSVFDTRVGHSIYDVACPLINNVAVCPQYSNMVACSCDGGGVLRVFDVRNGLKQLMEFKHPFKASMQAWSPTQPGLFAALDAETAAIRVLDLHWQGSKGFAEDTKTYSTIAQVPLHSAPILDVDWHPTSRGVLALVDAAGAVVHKTFHEHTACAFAPTGALFYTRDDGRFIEPKADDIATKMFKRTQAGYGLDARTNMGIVVDEPDLTQAWKWMQKASDTEEGQRPTFFGVEQALNMQTDMTQRYIRSPRSALGQSIGTVGQALSVSRVPPSDQRSFALELCSFPAHFDSDNIHEWLNRLIEQQQYERAATLAIFHQNISEALRCLRAATKSPEHPRYTQLALSSMALAGYQPPGEVGIDRWRETCRALLPQIDSPYLQAAFEFLIDQEGAHETIVQMTGLALGDRLGYACHYLDDDAIKILLDSLHAEAVAHGDLQGLLLTGMTPRGLDVLSAFLDRTADIQTTSLLLAAGTKLVSQSGSSTRELLASPLCSLWVETYRDLLDSWQAWMYRAKLDIAMPDGLVQKNSVGHVTIKCPSCKKSLVAKARNAESSTTACPSCRRPLPRCAVCLCRLSASDAHEQDGSVKFSSWFSWCQLCQHGGHVTHVQDWFATHTVCPVSSCSCECSRQTLPTSQPSIEVGLSVLN